jgi:protein-disulfide isomerase
VNLAIYALISLHDKRGWIRGIGSSIRTVLDARSALVVTLLLFGGVLTASQMAYSKLVVTQAGSLSERAQKNLNNARSHGTVVVPVSTSPRLGSDKAKTLVVKFSDFQCPFCKQFWHNIEQLHKLRDDVQIAFRHYPLSSECNPFMGSPFHKQACRAAYAAVCADRHGKFWEMGSALYANQPSFSELSLIRMASQIGLEPGPFKACLHDPTVRQKVIDDVLVGRSVGISGTPGCIIDGLRFEGALPEKMLSELIDTIADPKTSPAAPNTMITSMKAKVRTPQAAVNGGVHRLTHQDGTLPAVVGFVDPDRTPAAPLLRTLVFLSRQTAGMFPISIRLMSKTPLSRTIACALQHDEGPKVLARWLKNKVPTAKALTAAVTQLGANTKECMGGPETERALTEDQAAATALGIQEGGALFVGNIPMNPALSPAQIEQAVAWVAVQTHNKSTPKDSSPK